MKSHWIKVGPKSNSSYFSRRGGKGTQSYRQNRGHVETEADTGLMELKARNTEDRQSHQQLRGRKGFCSKGFSRDHRLADFLP